MLVNTSSVGSARIIYPRSDSAVSVAVEKILRRDLRTDSVYLHMTIGNVYADLSEIRPNVRGAIRWGGVLC